MNFILYHYPLCPFSRKIRVILKEKQIDFTLLLEKHWERRRDFLVLNPAGTTPVLVEKETKKAYSGNYALVELIEEKKLGHFDLLQFDYEKRYEIRNVTEWFDIKFFNEVTKYIIEEKIIKHISVNSSATPPNSSAIRAAKKNVIAHLDYLNHLLKKGTQYLCGERISLGDIAAASQLSVLDYMGDIPWEYSEPVKSWYALIKSRPSFRPLLEDEIPGIHKAPHYKNPDF